jgi:hypothetical protein
VPLDGAGNIFRGCTKLQNHTESGVHVCGPGANDLGAQDPVVLLLDQNLLESVGDAHTGHFRKFLDQCQHDVVMDPPVSFNNNNKIGRCFLSRKA